MFLISGLLFWSLIAPPGDDLVQAPTPRGNQEPLDVQEAKVIGRYKGKRQWQITARSMQVSSEKITQFQDIIGGAVYHEEDPYLHFTADSGFWYVENNDFELKGNIIAFNPEGAEIFRTSRVLWQAQDEVLLAPNRVWAQWGELIFQGDELQALIGEDVVFLQGNVNLTGPWYEVITQEVQYDLAEEQILLWGTGEAKFHITRKGE
jgi:hypothetical protein